MTSRFLLRPQKECKPFNFARCGAGVHNMVWHWDQRLKTFLLVIDEDRKQRESMQAPNLSLRVNYERLKTLDIIDTCQYLGYWGTGNGDISFARGVVREKVKVASDLIKSHSLTPELSTELFKSRTEKNRRLPVLGSPHRMVAK